MPKLQDGQILGASKDQIQQDNLRSSSLSDVWGKLQQNKMSRSRASISPPGSPLGGSSTMSHFDPSQFQSFSVNQAKGLRGSQRASQLLGNDSSSSTSSIRDAKDSRLLVLSNSIYGAALASQLMLHNNDGTGGSTSNLTGRQKVSSIYGSVYQPNGGTSPAANSVSSYSSLVAESKKKIPKEQKPSKDSRARRPSSPASSSLSPKNSIGSSDLGAPSPFISRQSSIKGFRKHPQSASQDFPAAPRFSKLADERSRSAIAKTHSVGSGDLINPVESNTSSSSLMAPKQYYTTTNASGSQILDSSLRQFAPYKSASSRDYASSESIPTKSMRTVASTTRSQQYKSENDPRRSSRSKHRTERSQDDDLASSRSPTTEDINSLRMQIQGLQSQLDSKKKEASTRSSTSSYDGSAAEKPKKTKWGLIHKIRKLFMKSKSKKESSSGSSYATDSAPASAPASAPVLVRGSDRM